MKNFDSFDIMRTMRMIKHDLTSNRKTYIKNFFICYAVLVVAYIFILWGYNITRADSIYEHHIHWIYLGNTLAVLSLSVIYIITTIFASQFSGCLNSKEKRQNYLMIPATMGEKFVSRAVIFVIIMPLVCIAAFLLADLTRLAIQPLFDIPDDCYESLIPYIWERIDINPFTQGSGLHNGINTVLDWLISVLWNIFVFSLFILGGCYWCKNSYIKIIFTLIVLILLMAFTGLTFHDCDFMTWLGRFLDTSYTDPTVVQVTVCTVLLLLTAACWWLAFILFRRNQIVIKKGILR